MKNRRVPYQRLLCDLEFRDQRFTGMGSLESESEIPGRVRPMKRSTLASIALGLIVAGSTVAQSTQAPRLDDSFSPEQAREESA